MRSLLFVPADSPAKLDKAMTSGADVILIDLEDSVAASAKAAARATLAGFLKAAAPVRERPRLYVRVNALDSGLTDADLDAAVGHGAEGLMLPKAQSGQDITRLDAKIAVREAVAGSPDGATRILAIVTETAASLFNLGSYRGASHRLSGLAWGGEDLAADLGASANKDEAGRWLPSFELARSLCLMGAVAAGARPIDSIYGQYRDLDGLQRDCERGVRDGFTAKMAIHPAQVAVINAAFTPSDAAIERASRIIKAFADAGDAGVIGLDGEMLDRPHLKRAERLLQRAGRLPSN